MKSLVPAWFIFSAAASVAAIAAQSTKNSSPEIIGRLAAEPDVVLEWNAGISDHFEEFSLASTTHIQARVYAMAHLAMRDAIAATTREARHDATGAIAKSAASAAAHDVLVALCPVGANRFASLQVRQVTAIANDSAATQGRQIGQRVAASVLSSRAADGWPGGLSRSTAESAAIDSLRGTVVKPTPFVLKRAQEFPPDPPYFIFSDGAIEPNKRLRKEKRIGTPADVESAAGILELWRTEPVVRWNRIARSIAVHQPQALHAQARLFAALNMALADALIAAVYWVETYRIGRTQAAFEGMSAPEPAHRILDAGALMEDQLKIPGSAAGPDLRELHTHTTGPVWVSRSLSNFPAIPATLAGAAETILRGSFSGEVVFAPPGEATAAGAQTEFTNLQSAVRQCAWAELIVGTSSFEGCLAGYDLGSRIGAHVLKQNRR
jgi:hypothetical protein